MGVCNISLRLLLFFCTELLTPPVLSAKVTVCIWPSGLEKLLSMVPTAAEALLSLSTGTCCAARARGPQCLDWCASARSSPLRDLPSLSIYELAITRVKSTQNVQRCDTKARVVLSTNANVGMRSSSMIPNDKCGYEELFYDPTKNVDVV